MLKQILICKWINSFKNLRNKLSLIRRTEKDYKYFIELRNTNIFWMRNHMITLIWWLAILLWLVINNKPYNHLISKQLNELIFEIWTFCIFLAISSSILFLLMNIVDIRLIWKKLKYIEKTNRDVIMKDILNDNYTKIEEYKKNLNSINHDYDFFEILLKLNDFVLIISLFGIIISFIPLYIKMNYLIIYLVYLGLALLLWLCISLYKKNQWK